MIGRYPRRVEAVQPRLDGLVGFGAGRPDVRFGEPSAASLRERGLLDQVEARGAEDDRRSHDGEPDEREARRPTPTSGAAAPRARSARAPGNATGRSRRRSSRATRRPGFRGHGAATRRGPVAPGTITASTSRPDPTPIARCVASPYQGRKMSPCCSGTASMNAREREQHACSRPAAERGEREPRRASSLELGAEHGERHADRKPVEQARQAHHQRLPAVVERGGQRAGEPRRAARARPVPRAAIQASWTRTRPRVPGTARHPRHQPGEHRQQRVEAHLDAQAPGHAEPAEDGLWSRRSATVRSSSRRRAPNTPARERSDRHRRSARPSTPAGSAPRAGDA